MRVKFGVEARRDDVGVIERQHRLFPRPLRPNLQSRSRLQLGLWKGNEERNVTIQGYPRDRSKLQLRSSHRATGQHPLLLRPAIRKAQPALPVRAKLTQFAPSSTPSHSGSAPLFAVHWDLHFLARGAVCEVCSCRECCCCGGCYGFWRCCEWCWVGVGADGDSWDGGGWDRVGGG